MSGWVESANDVMYLEKYLPRNFLAQQWRASKDLDSAVPTGAAGGMGSFWFHGQPRKVKSYYSSVHLVVELYPWFWYIT